METTRQKRAAPFYAAAAVWLAYALVLPLYEPLHYALAAGASLLALAAAGAPGGGPPWCPPSTAAAWARSSPCCWA